MRLDKLLQLLCQYNDRPQEIDVRIENESLIIQRSQDIDEIEVNKDPQ